MTTGNLFYRASGGVDYAFRFAWIPGPETWRIYIVRQPSYGSRSSDAHSTHRLGLPTQPYVCWAGALPTFSAARAVAALWADSTQRYIATGQFALPTGDRDVNDRSTYREMTEQQLRVALTERPNQPLRPLPIHPQPPESGRGLIRRLRERIG